MSGEAEFIEVSSPCNSTRAVFPDDAEPIKCYSCDTMLAIDAGKRMGTVKKATKPTPTNVFAKRYAATGLKMAPVISGIGVVGFLIDPPKTTPATEWMRGSLLPFSLRLNIILFGWMFSFTLLCSSIGWAIGAVKDFFQKRLQPPFIGNCANCGKPVIPPEKFCTHCGKPVLRALAV